MTLDVDGLLERRKLRRSRSTWRVLAIFFAVVAIVGYASVYAGLWERVAGTQHVARVSLEGFIAIDRPTLDLFETLRDDDTVEAVIIRINSPGGLSVAGEMIYEGLRDLSEAKPLIAVVDGVGTSAAYLAASASEHIVARNGSIVGSIGVIAQFPDVTGLLNRIGIDVYQLRSGDLKGQPSPFGTPSEEALAALNTLIEDNFSWFVGVIADERGLSESVIRSFEGDVFTGRRAIDVGLIDTLGGEEAALSYLAETHGIDEDIRVRDRAPSRPVNLQGISSLGDFPLISLNDQGVTVDVKTLREEFRDAMLLDGLLSLWHGR